MKASEKHESHITPEEQDFLNSEDIDFFDFLMYKEGLLPAGNIKEEKSYYEIEISTVNLYQPSMEFMINADINILSISFLMTRGLAILNHYYYLSIKRHFELPTDAQLDTLSFIPENGYIRVIINKTKEKNFFKRVVAEIGWFWKSACITWQKYMRRSHF